MSYNIDTVCYIAMTDSTWLNVFGALFACVTFCFILYVDTTVRAKWRKEPD